MLKLNGYEVGFFKFPAGEVGIKTNSGDYLNTIYADIKSSDEFMAMLLLADLVGSVQTLIIPYIPYGRQDRACHAGEPFSLRVAARLINTICAKKVITIDPHSHVTNALINNLIIVDESDYLPAADKFDCIVSPDAGAAKKTEKYSAKLSLPIVQCLKERNQFGEITRTTVHGEVIGKRCLIVDDICDGGATFIAIADALRNGGADYIHLHVSHGIFSKGINHLLSSGIDAVTSINYQEIF